MSAKEYHPYSTSHRDKTYRTVFFRYLLRCFKSCFKENFLGQKKQQKMKDSHSQHEQQWQGCRKTGLYTIATNNSSSAVEDRPVHNQPWQKDSCKTGINTANNTISTSKKVGLYTMNNCRAVKLRSGTSTHTQVHDIEMHCNALTQSKGMHKQCTISYKHTHIRAQQVDQTTYRKPCMVNTGKEVSYTNVQKQHTHLKHTQTHTATQSSIHTYYYLVLNAHSLHLV